MPSVVTLGETNKPGFDASKLVPKMSTIKDPDNDSKGIFGGFTIDGQPVWFWYQPGENRDSVWGRINESLNGKQTVKFKELAITVQNKLKGNRAMSEAIATPQFNPAAAAVPPAAQPAPAADAATNGNATAAPKKAPGRKADPHGTLATKQILPGQPPVVNVTVQQGNADPEIKEKTEFATFVINLGEIAANVATHMMADGVESFIKLNTRNLEPTERIAKVRELFEKFKSGDESVLAKQKTKVQSKKAFPLEVQAIAQTFTLPLLTTMHHWEQSTDEKRAAMMARPDVANTYAQLLSNTMNTNAGGQQDILGQL